MLSSVKTGKKQHERAYTSTVEGLSETEYRSMIINDVLQMLIQAQSKMKKMNELVKSFSMAEKHVDKAIYVIERDKK